MLQKLLQQFRIFSRENWWIYVFLFIALTIVVYTGKGNIYEVCIIFFINLSGAMCNMLMMSSYKDKKWMEGSIFIMMANIIYTSISLYAWLHDGDMQYIFWQASFLLTWFKALMLYNYKIDLKYINFWTILLLNTWVMYILIRYIWLSWAAIIQSFWIAGITLWLALKNDITRYFFILVGNTLTLSGTSMLLITDFNSGSILWITVAYALLWLSICTYNYRILPTYISRFKNT